MGNKKKEDSTEESSDFRNPNAEDYVLQPGEKRVRFSICEATFAPQVNFAYEEEDEGAEDMEDSSPSTFQQVRSRRRDSAYPLDINQGEDDKRIFIDSEDSESSTNKTAQDLKTLGDDPYEITDFEEEEPGTPWAELETRDKIWKVTVGIGKLVGLLGLLYFFVCSLDLLSKGFRLIGGRTAGEIFQQSDILQNPVVGVMIGILTTVLVQSSSTSTSIIVGMVAAGFMDVKLAIPLIMGANIGTSITNTIVSFMQAGDREQFRRAFAGATILDMFNWITVIVLLIVEVITGYLYHVSKAVVEVLVPDSENGGEVKLLSVLTEPFVNLIVQLDESVLECWSNPNGPNCTDKVDASLIKENCSSYGTSIEVTEKGYDARGVLVYSPHTIVLLQENVQKCDKEFLFAGTSMSDALVGVIVTLGSLIVLCSCLIFVVKLLSSVLKGHVSVIIKKTLNADIPYVPWITGYLAIIVGAVMTFIVQSSSVFTSALTPLVGLGVISLKRVYPLTLGANIGTTTTAILASLATTGNSFQPSMQIALCHFFFNITGILLFYPIPFMRFPIHMAKFLGDTTAEYRWFAVVYMVLMFAVFPAVFIGLSFAGSFYVIILVSIIGVILAAITITNVMQSKYPKFLPPFMRTWEWIPLPLRSLKPYDDFFSRLPCCAKCRPASEESEEKSVAPISDSQTVDDGNNFVYYSGGSTIPPPPSTLLEEDSHNNHSSSSNGNSNLFNGAVSNTATSNYSDSKPNSTAKSNGHHQDQPGVNGNGASAGGMGSLGSHNNEAFDKGSSESVIV